MSAGGARVRVRVFFALCENGVFAFGGEGEGPDDGGVGMGEVGGLGGEGGFVVVLVRFGLVWLPNY